MKTNGCFSSSFELYDTVIRLDYIGLTTAAVPAQVLGGSVELSGLDFTEKPGKHNANKMGFSACRCKIRPACFSLKALTVVS